MFKPRLDISFFLTMRSSHRNGMLVSKASDWFNSDWIDNQLKGQCLASFNDVIKIQNKNQAQACAQHQKLETKEIVANNDVISKQIMLALQFACGPFLENGQKSMSANPWNGQKRLHNDAYLQSVLPDLKICQMQKNWNCFVRAMFESVFKNHCNVDSQSHVLVWPDTSSRLIKTCVYICVHAWKHKPSIATCSALPWLLELDVVGLKCQVLMRCSRLLKIIQYSMSGQNIR